MEHNELTYLIRGAIFEVYNTLGPGLLESVYEEALCYELSIRGLQYERQKRIPLIYKGQELTSDLRLDILVENQIVIELKAVEEIKTVFYKQLKTYLKLTNLNLGLLVNFSSNDMQKGIHRVIL
ncbi:GxxExxY protein [Prevotella sp. tf2-5]|jgi:GxxExxY protein|uniref:GxxExxY protein n=1 Tax=Prevotella sp. tf2-5 TaxID=1761889 RepID=UPI0008F3A41B|nr:GxxExxY protein [Prevotella sp. tf2-5]SFP01905.1 GxxExxY protein [Prevotella sp. tf2-5]